MEIQINTDHSIALHEPLTMHVESAVTEALNCVNRATRVVVHLSVSNDAKSCNGDHRCLMEARIDGHPPIASGDHAANLHQAIQRAAGKLKRSIDSTLGRINDNAKGGKFALEADTEKTASGSAKNSVETSVMPLLYPYFTA